MNRTIGFALLLASTACSTAYYATLEKFGVEKRNILADRIAAGRDDQAEAKERFRTTLERFKSLADFDGGDLESAYGKFSRDLERCEDSAEKIESRIDSIDEVAHDLFGEWKSENEQYEDADLRRRSDELLAETRERYASLIASMQRAEARMEPVLVVFRDQVRFLKHNLNAKAVASLEGTFSDVEGEVLALVSEMERSIDEADRFIESLD